MSFSGAPGVETNIVPIGFIPGTGNFGIICTQIPCRRGERGKVYLIGSENDFYNQLGGTLPDDDSAMLVLKSLSKGAKYRITRAFHYTNPAQIGTVDGDVAEGEIDIAQVTEVLASGTVQITGGTSSPGVNRVVQISVNGVNLMSGPVDWATSNTATATGIAANAAAHTSSPEYTVTSATDTVTIKPLAGTGASVNGFVIVVTVAGDVTVTASPTLTGGVTAVTASNTAWESLEVGDGYNGTTITVTNSVNNDPAFVDIAVSLPDAISTFTVQKVAKATTTQPQIDALNKRLKAAGCQVKVASVTGGINPGVATLSGGAQDITAIDDDDVNGSQAAKTGWYAFDDTMDSMRVFNIAFPNRSTNQGVADYCANRLDMVAMGRFPLGLSIQGMNDYRDGTGVYTGQPINTEYFTFVVSDGYINNPDDSNDSEYLVTGLAELAAARSKADDQRGPWWSIGEENYNRLSSLNGVPTNLASQGNRTQWDVLYEKGVNAIVNDPVQKVIFVGNRTSLLDKTNLLSKANIMDGAVFIARSLSAIARRMNFKPNDIRMFNEYYRRCRPFITDTLIPGRCIEGGSGQKQGEGEWWHWNGDQYATSLNDLKTNTKQDVDSGGYKVQFVYKPIASNEWIRIEISPADSGTITNISVVTQP